MLSTSMSSLWPECATADVACAAFCSSSARRKASAAGASSFVASAGAAAANAGVGARSGATTPNCSVDMVGSSVKSCRMGATTGSTIASVTGSASGCPESAASASADASSSRSSSIKSASRVCAAALRMCPSWLKSISILMGWCAASHESHAMISSSMILARYLGTFSSFRGWVGSRARRRRWSQARIISPSLLLFCLLP